MAKVKRNALIQGISGTLGRDLVFRQMRDGSTIVSAKPDFSNRVFSRGQLTHQKRFQEAASYARSAAKTKSIYAELAKGTTKTAYNIALSDWFNPPVIHAVRRQGARIVVEARDNVLVARVVVMILDGEGQVMEQGEGTPVNDATWEYVSDRAGMIRVEVWDLAGNVTKSEVLNP